MTHHLLLQARLYDGTPTDDCRWRVRIGDDGALVDVNGASVQLDDEALQKPIYLECNPTSRKLWPATGTLVWRARGLLEPQQLHANWELEISGGTSSLTSKRPRIAFTHVVACLSRFRDVSDEAARKLDRTDNISPREDRIPVRPLDGRGNLTPPARQLNLIASMVGHEPDVERTRQLPTENVTIDPDARVVMLQPRDPDGGPRLYALVWPHALDPAPGSEPTPFLVELRNQVNAGTFYQGYDRLTDFGSDAGWDFLMYAFYQWVYYQFDVLLGDPFPPQLPPGAPVKGPSRATGDTKDTRMGWAYQPAAAGRKVVVVIPLNGPSPGATTQFDEILDGERAGALLDELQALLFRRARLHRPPGVGRVAYAAFSSGHGPMKVLLDHAVAADGPKASARARAYFDKVREVYFFDPPDQTGLLQGVVTAALAWRKRDATRVVRLYNQVVVSGFHDALLPPPAGQKPPSAPFLRVSDDGSVSVGVFDIATWKRTQETVGNPHPGLFQNEGAHAEFPSLLLRDALERSAFPRR